MKLLERHPLPLGLAPPALRGSRAARSRRKPSPYGYALPRNGLAPAAVVAIVAAALAAGGWLGLQTGSGGGGTAGPAGLLDLQAPAAADEADRDADRRPQHRTRRRPARPRGRDRGPSEQAAAALALRRAHLRAATGFDGARAARPRAAPQRHAPTGSSRVPPRRGDRRTYARASTAVASAERDLERLIGSVL